MLGERLREAQAKLAEVEMPKTEARRELRLVAEVAVEREKQELLAIRLSSPDYISRELGERPADPGKAKQWDRAVPGGRELTP